jgi:hypothetical protein
LQHKCEGVRCNEKPWHERIDCSGKNLKIQLIKLVTIFSDDEIVLWALKSRNSFLKPENGEKSNFANINIFLI